MNEDFDFEDKVCVNVNYYHIEQIVCDQCLNRYTTGHVLLHLINARTYIIIIIRHSVCLDVSLSLVGASMCHPELLLTCSHILDCARI